MRFAMPFGTSPRNDDGPPDTPPPNGQPAGALRIGDLVIPVPIVQGGMGIGVSMAGLASSVANQGALGVIAAVGIGMSEPDFRIDFLAANLRALRREIHTAKARTEGVVGVNIMVALKGYEEYVQAAVEEGVDIIFSGAGLPTRLPGLLPEGSATKLVPIVSSGRAAALLCRSWYAKHNRFPDAFVVEGPLAGGHLGFKPDQITDPDYRLEHLVPQTVEAVAPFEKALGRPIPVIAAGGIYTHADVRRFIDLGAAGVQMGTRFVTTHECDVSDAFKKVYIDSRQEDIVVIHSPVGMPGRAIRNAYLDAVYETNRPLPKVRCGYRCLTSCKAAKSRYCIADALVAAQHGDLDHGFAFAGANAWRTDRICSVAELIDELWNREHPHLATAADAACVPG